MLSFKSIANCLMQGAVFCDFKNLACGGKALFFSSASLLSGQTVVASAASLHVEALPEKVRGQQRQEDGRLRGNLHQRG
jgi:hypothetical protein